MSAASKLEDALNDLIVEQLDSMIDDKLNDFKPEVSADDVDGLGAEIEDAIGNIDAGDIRGIEDLVDERSREVAEVVMQDSVKAEMASILATPEFRTTVEGIIKEVFAGMVAKLLNPPIPIAIPVTVETAS